MTASDHHPSSSAPRPAADPQRWARHLRAIAEPAITDDGHRRDADLGAPLRAFVRPGPDRAMAPAAPARARLEDPAVALWWALVDDRIDVDGAVTGGDGPIVPESRYHAIETWTDSTLAALHALWWHAARANGARRAALQGRVAAARAWHVEHTQPDNATGRPWALHVFLLDPAPEGVLYAETLLHNCLATSGRPEPFSALVLLDAARALETTANGPAGA